MIHCTPEVVHLAVDLPVDLVEMPAPMRNATHAADPLPTDVACEHGAKPVPPEPHRLMAKIDAAFEQQVLDVPQRQREPYIHHHHKADHLG